MPRLTGTGTLRLAEPPGRREPTWNRPLATPLGDWASQGACRGHDPDLFFAAAADVQARRYALAICGTCPVTAECLAHALDAGENLTGIWGGKTGKQRRAMRRGKAAV